MYRIKTYLSKQTSKLLTKKMLAVLFACVLAVAATPFAAHGAVVPASNVTPRDIPPPWSTDKAWQWYNATPWSVGANFIPSTASNELEMWQPATFDPATIDKELGYLADKLKMNTVRVFLHVLPWFYSDGNLSPNASTEFLARIDQFLGICAKHNVKPLLVLFDDCWNVSPVPGPQPAPIPFLHNSRWVESPALAVLQDVANHDKTLKPYAVGVMSHFAQDKRIFGWDLYNEPGNGGKEQWSLNLLKEVFAWAREVNPSQPVTTCVWTGRYDKQGDDARAQINRFTLENSDVITFHDYGPLSDYISNSVVPLKAYGRPLICTEYMARTMGSTFQAILPFAKAYKIGSINWGLVNGKTQTIYPWDSWQKHYDKPPAVWFHDILQPDGTPFDQKEVDLIVNLIKVNH